MFFIYFVYFCILRGFCSILYFEISCAYIKIRSLVITIRIRGIRGEIRGGGNIFSCLPRWKLARFIGTRDRVETFFHA